MIEIQQMKNNYQIIDEFDSNLIILVLSLLNCFKTNLIIKKLIIRK